MREDDEANTASTLFADQSAFSVTTPVMAYPIAVPVKSIQLGFFQSLSDLLSIEHHGQDAFIDSDGL
jgi:hypothetical protein